MNKDRIYLNQILELEKNISNYYSLFLNEASNDYLYENIFSMMEDSKDMAREIYNLMYINNWYNIEEVDNNKLDMEIKYLENVLKELS